MKYAYLRVSSTDQNLDRQLDWIHSLCPDMPESHIFMDKSTGRNTNRHAYQELKSTVTEGDEVYVKELDRLGRVKAETKDEIEWFKEQGVRLRIANIPTTLMDFGEQEWVLDMVNNILLEVLGAMAEQEWVTRKTRQTEGIAAAQSRGVKFGRPRLDVENFEKIYKKTLSKEMTVNRACEVLGVSRSTWYNLVRAK